MNSTTLLQIFCKSMLYYKVIFKSLTGLDSTGETAGSTGMNVLNYATGGGRQVTLYNTNKTSIFFFSFLYVKPLYK